MPLRDIDRQLIDRCLRKDPGAWNDFVDRYMGLIYHVIHHLAHARSFALSAADTEDLAAEIFLQIVDDDYATLRRFKGASSLPTYLTVVARRICVKELIRRHREAELGHAHAHRAVLNQDRGEQAEAIASAEEVERMLEDLPEREAEVVRLYHLQYQNYRQIARQLGIPENSVGPVLAKARQHLRRTAEHRGAPAVPESQNAPSTSGSWRSAR
ncbi:MAG: sigma-70 family RNA polymerase sigma factor [Planctomycetaceae bacterium]|nr:sigma-70 family RNA polymerase sigma factor [Planctomycetaceae bacterium]